MVTAREFAAIQFDMLLTACVRIEAMMQGQDALHRLAELCAESIEGDPGPLARNVLAIVHGWATTGTVTVAPEHAEIPSLDALELFGDSVFQTLDTLALQFEERAEMADNEVERTAWTHAAYRLNRRIKALSETLDGIKLRVRGQ